MGETVAGACQRVILYEDPEYLRGRAPGETIALLQVGLSRGGLDGEAVEVIGGEEEAVNWALRAAEADDLVIIMTARSRDVVDLVNRYKEQVEDSLGANDRP